MIYFVVQCILKTGYTTIIQKKDFAMIRVCIYVYGYIQQGKYSQTHIQYLDIDLLIWQENKENYTKISIILIFSKPNSVDAFHAEDR